MNCSHPGLLNTGGHWDAGGKTKTAVLKPQSAKTSSRRDQTGFDVLQKLLLKSKMFVLMSLKARLTGKRLRKQQDEPSRSSITCSDAHLVHIKVSI